MARRFTHAEFKQTPGPALADFIDLVSLTEYINSPNQLISLESSKMGEQSGFMIKLPNGESAFIRAWNNQEKAWNVIAKELTAIFYAMEKGENQTYEELQKVRGILINKVRLFRDDRIYIIALGIRDNNYQLMGILMNLEKPGQCITTEEIIMAVDTEKKIGKTRLLIDGVVVSDYITVFFPRYFIGELSQQQLRATAICKPASIAQAIIRCGGDLAIRIMKKM
jgi:hypothetical protein